jgi:hypothetical protein
VFSVGEYCVRGAWAHQQGGWAVRGLGDLRTDHFAPLVRTKKNNLTNIGHQILIFMILRGRLGFLRSRQNKKYPYFAHHKSSKKAINHGQNAASATSKTNKFTTQPIPSND